MSGPAVSIVVPTRDRGDYLRVALESLAAQDFDEPYEAIVVDDASDEPVEHAGVRVIRQDSPRGPNAARNAGIELAQSDLIALIDDDVYAPPRWLRALVDGARRHPDAAVVGGPIRARFEGPTPRGCGREQPPITTLDLGADDVETRLVWSANMALRRDAFELAGPFDESFSTGGDEEEWLRRLTDEGGKVVYVADAGLDHRRAGEDARLGSLMRNAYRRGRNVGAYDRRRGTAPGLPRELRVLAGCGWHAMRRGCPQGLVMGAHSAGRVVEAVRRR
jgi:glycosyltransferase involved in cell wall biosynthesis